MRRGRKMSSIAQRLHSDRTAAEAPRRVVDHRPHVLADRPAEQEQESFRPLDQNHAGLTGDRAGAEAARRRLVGTEIECTEASDRLPRLWTEDRERGVVTGHVEGALWSLRPSQHQRPRRRERTHPRVALAPGDAELAGHARYLPLS